MQKFLELWEKSDHFEKFELVLSLVVVVVVSVIACFAVARLVVTVIELLVWRMDFLEPTAFQTLFGMIFIILIALEFNRSIVHALSSSLGTVQIKGIILIAVMVVVRKLIVTDVKDISLEGLLGMSALLLALGLLYFFIGWTHEGRAD